MAQHDMNIANQGFPATRTDINNALSALNSMHSGTSRPSGATTGTMWLDTTNSGSNSLIIKFFDGSEDITLATIDTSANTVDFDDSAGTGVTGKVEGTNFTGSILVGHTTTGTLSSAGNNTGVGIASLDAITQGDDNVAVGNSSATALTTGSDNVAIGSCSLKTLTSNIES